jgi:transcriptional regulator with XRE-family HTH domain
VVDEAGLGDFVTDLRSPDRVYAVVAVAWSLDGDGPVIPTSRIRTIVESSARVYVVPTDALLRALRREIGSKLALAPGAARIWWPGVTRRSDPWDHPLVLPREGESAEDVLAEFALQFHMSRPDVRREIKLIEDARALAEHRLEEAEKKEQMTAQRLRDAHVERNREATRAEAADTAKAALETVKRQLQAACGLAGVGRQLGLQALAGDAAEQASILRGFGENVAAFRAEAGLSQVELSKRCFIRADQVSRLERGERVPSLLILLVLAQAVNVSVADLTADLSPLTRETGRERMRTLIAKTPRSQHQKRQLEQASGFPGFYAATLLSYMAAFGEIIKEDHGYELAPHRDRRG